MPKAPPAIAESLARTGERDGTRSYQSFPDNRSGVLVDEHGRLLVRTTGPVGFESGGNGTDLGYTQQFVSGSAPEYDNVGLVVFHRVMQRPQDAIGGSGVITCLRTFGYSAVAGWVQLILKDESGGVNPPVVNDVPEITIAVGANQNFFFGNWILANDGFATQDKATYIAISTTGPTFTPAGAPSLWFSFIGAL